MKANNEVRAIRRLLLVFIIMLFLSGLTAIPVEAELAFLLECFERPAQLNHWLEKVLLAYKRVDQEAPFLLYAYDWLAFAHFILAILFIGPYANPVRNIWVIQFGLIACVLIFPLAFIAGHFRGIPLGWRLIDCSFGLFGAIPLAICHQKCRKLSYQTS
jgi:hypothetical protein